MPYHGIKLVLTLVAWWLLRREIIIIRNFVLYPVLRRYNISWFPFHFCASSHRYRDINIWNIRSCKGRSRSRGITLTTHNDIIQWQMLKSKNVISCSVALVFTVFEILTFEVWPCKGRSRSKRITFTMISFDRPIFIS